MNLTITTKNMEEQKMYIESKQVYNFDEVSEMFDFLKLCLEHSATDCTYEIS